MKSAALSNIGALRMVNQDSVFNSDDPVGIFPNLYLVADGMGGHAAGEKASQGAVKASVSFANEEQERLEQEAARGIQIERDEQWLGESLARMTHSANRAVYQMAVDRPSWHGMGTTLVGACVTDLTIFVVNVGDSRLYVVNDHQQLRRVTTDHSLVEELVRKGDLTEEEARNHPQRNYITRAVGTASTVQCDLYEIDRNRVRMLLLCSDGLSSQIQPERIEEIINMKSVRLEDRATMLVNEANRNGGSDNISLILVDLEGGV